MKKEYDKKKKLVILILAAVAVCLAGGLWFYLAKNGKPSEPDKETMQDSAGQVEVTVPEIEVPETTETPEETESPKETEAPEETDAEESGTDGEDPEQAGSEESEPADSRSDEAQIGAGSEEPQTREDAQAPSEKPEVIDGDSVENPEQPPQYEPEVTEPEQKPEEPAGGSTNGSGQVYVPGFGYVDPPGAAQGESAGSNGDWDKQIGDMN